MRRARGFTLVELLVSLFVLALLASLSWQGIDGMLRARRETEVRADQVLTLQTALAQWTADLDAMVSLAPSPALDWNGRVLRLTRSSSLAAGDGIRVVGWARRAGQWRRWQSTALYTRGDLETAWQQADAWSQSSDDGTRAQEVTVGPLDDWQIFYFRGNAWTNPLSTSAGSVTATAAQQAASAAGPVTTPAAGALPDGIRLVLLLPAGRALSGRLQRDWVRPTLTPS